MLNFAVIAMVCNSLGCYWVRPMDIGIFADQQTCATEAIRPNCFPMSAMSPYRLQCCIPFCRRTIKAGPILARGHDEWICSTHWTSTFRHWRRRLFLFRRRGRQDLEAKMWERLKRQAIERAAGIA